MRANSKAAPSIDDAAKVALMVEKKGKALVDTTPQEAFEDDAVNSKRQHQDHPTPDGTVRTCSSEGASQAPPPGFAPPEAKDTIEDGEVIDISAEDQIKLRALRIKNNHLKKQKYILEAKRQRVTMQAKVRQMIQDEEQRAWELEQEIMLMQGEGQYNLQRGPLAPLAPLQQYIQAGDRFIPQRDPFIPLATSFLGINYLDERTPWLCNSKHCPGSTYPKYNGSTDPAQYIMSYQVTAASSGGNDATMAKFFIIALEGPALTWYTRLLPLSIDSLKGLRDKFLLKFQGY